MMMGIALYALNYRTNVLLLLYHQFLPLVPMFLHMRSLKLRLVTSTNICSGWCLPGTIVLEYPSDLQNV